MSHQILQLVFMLSHCRTILMWIFFFWCIVTCIWDYMTALIQNLIMFHFQSSKWQYCKSCCCESFLRFCINLAGADDPLCVYLKPFCLCCACLNSKVQMLFFFLSLYCLQQKRRMPSNLFFGVFFPCLLKGKCHFLWTIFVHMNVTGAQLKNKSGLFRAPNQCFPWKALQSTQLWCRLSLEPLVRGEEIKNKTFWAKRRNLKQSHRWRIHTLRVCAGIPSDWGHSFLKRKTLSLF